eukprot:COSAG04_NODE_1715_length_5819_cov_5.914336_2_plen_106_part_00
MPRRGLWSSALTDNCVDVPWQVKSFADAHDRRSPADLAGVMVGSRIVAVNGAAVVLANGRPMREGWSVLQEIQSRLEASHGATQTPPCVDSRPRLSASTRRRSSV